MANQRKCVLASAIVAAAGLAVCAGAEKIAAQKAADEILAAHPEITSLELAAARSDQEGCKTVAATEAKEIGEKCDNDELTAIKTNRPLVEQEKDEFDVTCRSTMPAGRSSPRRAWTLRQPVRQGK
jgi:hypothetical protein